MNREGMQTCIGGVGLGEGDHKRMAGIANSLCEHELRAQSHGDDVASQNVQWHIVSHLSLRSKKSCLSEGAQVHMNVGPNMCSSSTEMCNDTWKALYG